MHIADDDDVRASYIVVSLCHNNLPPVSSQLSFHVMNRSEKLKKRILLENQSTAHLLSNPSLLYNIRPVAEPVGIYSRGGTTHCDTEGIL